MTDSEVAGNIILSTVTSPYLFVLDPLTHEYYLLDDTATQQQLSVDVVVQFLDDVDNGSLQVSSVSVSVVCECE